MPKLPWFRLYAKDFITDENVQVMTDTEVGRYIKLLIYQWINGSIPKDKEKIKQLLSVRQTWIFKRCDLNTLFPIDGEGRKNVRLEKERISKEIVSNKRSEAGKLGAKAKWGADSKCHNFAMAKNGYTDTDTELEEEEKKRNIERKEEGRPLKGACVCPHQEIVDLYHETCPTLPKVREWGETSKKALRARWKERKERQNLTWWRTLFTNICNNEFLAGKNDREWQASLPWIVKAANMEKVLNGAYARKKMTAKERWLV